MRSICILIQEPTIRGVIIPRLQIVELGGTIVIITSVPEGVTVDDKFVCIVGHRLKLWKRPLYYNLPESFALKIYVINISAKETNPIINT